MGKLCKEFRFPVVLVVLVIGYNVELEATENRDALDLCRVRRA